MAADISDQIAGAGSLQRMYNNNALVQLVNAYEIEFIVVFSFLLQVVVLFLAGYRRRHDSPVVKSIVLYSYLLADYAATYGLGHLSVSTRPPERQQLVAFWAPFLLLHLGGPDSITAYSLEDNKLWYRKLFVDFITQVLGAVYVLYKTFTSGSGPLLPAAWLIFAVGVAKYAERIWALYNGSISTIRSAIDKQNAADDGGSGQKWAPQVVPSTTGDRSPEDLLIFAHSQFQVCKGAMVDSPGVFDDTSKLEKTIFSKTWKWEDKWTVFQMEVSLLYDIMYTKAGIIHNWYGYCLRVFSPLATAAALLLFFLSRSGSTSSSMGAATTMNSPPVLVDVAITYVLLVGAILLDIASLLSAAGSGWAYAFLVLSTPRGAAICSGGWRRLHRWLESLRELVNAADGRKWSGAIGQYNVLQFCITTSKEKKYSSTCVEIPKGVMEVVFNKLIEVILRLDQKNSEPHKGRNTRRNDVKVVFVDDDCVEPERAESGGTTPIKDHSDGGSTYSSDLGNDDPCVEPERAESGGTTTIKDHSDGGSTFASDLGNDDPCVEPERAESGGTTPIKDHSDGGSTFASDLGNDDPCVEPERAESGGTTPIKDHSDGGSTFASDLGNDDPCVEPERAESGGTIPIKDHSDGGSTFASDLGNDDPCVEPERAESGGTIPIKDHSDGGSTFASDLGNDDSCVEPERAESGGTIPIKDHSDGGSTFASDLGNDDPDDRVSIPEEQTKEGPTGNKSYPMNSLGLIKTERGQIALEKLAADEDEKHKLKRYIRDEIQEGILIWHIATDIFLRTSEEAKKNDKHTVQQVDAIRFLSNYMMFLVVERPSMVPGLALRRQFKETCDQLLNVAKVNRDANRLAEFLARRENNLVLKKKEKLTLRGNALRLATKLALRLADLKNKFPKPLSPKEQSASQEDMSVDTVGFLVEMWVEMLLYVSHRCSKESHARKLSEGGELTTVVWLMAEQASKFFVDKQLSEEDKDE